MTYTTLDSGERQVYSSGMRRDTQDGKPRFDLLIPRGLPYERQLLTRLARLMERGAEKYGERNWESAYDQEALDRAHASALRHHMQWACGEMDEDHAAAIVFNVMQAEYLRWRVELEGIQQAVNRSKIVVEALGGECTYGADCKAHPGVNSLHDFDFLVRR